MLNGIEAEDYGRPRLRSGEDHMTQCPFPLRRVSVDTSRMLEGFHVSSREVREERGPRDVVQGTSAQPYEERSPSAAR